jgi:hypothetical protein
MSMGVAVARCNARRFGPRRVMKPNRKHGHGCMSARRGYHHRGTLATGNTVVVNRASL